MIRGVTPPRNLVNLSEVGKEYAGQPILRDVSLGVAADERIGVVGHRHDEFKTVRVFTGKSNPQPAQSWVRCGNEQPHVIERQLPSSTQYPRRTRSPGGFGFAILQQLP